MHVNPTKYLNDRIPSIGSQVYVALLYPSLFLNKVIALGRSVKTIIICSRGNMSINV